MEYLSLQLAKTHTVHILAPHTKGAKTHEIWFGDDNGGSDNQPSIEVFRFHYFFARGERLAYNGGILANLSQNPFKYLLVPIFMLSQLFSIARLHRKNKYHSIHAHWIIPQGFLAVIYKGISRNNTPPKVMVTSHGGDLFALNRGVLNSLKRWTLNRADLITVVSNVMKTRCAGLGIPENKIVVRSMGVDLLRRFTPGPSSESSRTGIIFVGRLVEKKGVQYLIQAMVSIQKRHPDAVLHIVGDGPMRTELETLTHSIGLADGITFVGQCINREIPMLLRKARIAVIPSIIAKSGDQEGLGLVAVEAMGCGCAVVASDLAAIRDVVSHAETGLLAQPQDPDDLADKISELLSNPAYLRQLAENGRQSAKKHFDWTLVGKAYSKMIKDL